MRIRAVCRYSSHNGHVSLHSVSATTECQTACRRPGNTCSVLSIWWVVRAQDAIVALREKLQRLREMSARNARDRVVSAQVGWKTHAPKPAALLLQHMVGIHLFLVRGGRPPLGGNCAVSNVACTGHCKRRCKVAFVWCRCGARWKLQRRSWRPQRQRPRMCIARCMPARRGAAGYLFRGTCCSMGKAHQTLVSLYSSQLCGEASPCCGPRSE